MAVRLTRTNWVALTAVVLIAVQLVIRAILAFKGYFYWDDLILVGRAGTQGLFSPGYLFDDHDGHVMPAAFLVAGVITHLAPLNWVGPAISLVVLQLLASLAARPAHPVDVRPLHPTGHTWLRMVGSRIELPAHARRNGMGDGRRHSSCAHRQSALRPQRPARLLQRPALFR